MDELTAEQLGRDDRKADKINIPFANPAICAKCHGAAVGTKTHLLRAYNRGRQQENNRIVEHELVDQGFYDVANDRHVR
jgi:hypothetical protein